jgi:hypothetical protein
LYPYASKCSGVLAPVDPIQNAHCGRTAAGRRWVLTGYAGEFRPPALRADQRWILTGYSQGTQASSIRQHCGRTAAASDGLFGGASARVRAHVQSESGGLTWVTAAALASGTSSGAATAVQSKFSRESIPATVDALAMQAACMHGTMCGREHGPHDSTAYNNMPLQHAP